ncbi:hypothetical protein Tsubulata_017630, partial [Turnera subulata]
TTTTLPWLEELRKLRVAELKRELQRYDLSIVSLQLKVKRLKEETATTDKSDLERRVDENEPESLRGGGEDSDRDNRSVNESNSPDPKVESPAAGPEPEPTAPGADGVRGDVKLEDSCDSAAEEPVVEVDFAHSKEEEEAGSDEQSSASLPGGEKKREPEGDEQTPAIKIVLPVESQPLVDLLDMLRSHKLGSLFQRRLDTQENPAYVSLIRQHMDLETIRTKLEEGRYIGCQKSFFRDLLLLFTNAIVFFDKNTSESQAAVELLQLVSNEMASTLPVPDLSLKERPFFPTEPGPEPEPEPQPLAVKPKMRVVMVACRKRSSIAASQSSPLSSGADKKGEQTDKKGEETRNSTEEQPVIDVMQLDKSSDKGEENRITRKRTRGRFNPGAKISDKNTGRSSPKANKNSDAGTSSGLSGKAGSLSDNVEVKVEKDRKSRTNGSAKKKGVVNFLDRIKQGVATGDKSSPGSSKQPKMASDSSNLSEKSRSSNRKGQDSQKGSAGRRERESRNSGKRNAGRPPKRTPASPVPSTVVTAKRSREPVGAGSSGNSRKRSRR